MKKQNSIITTIVCCFIIGFIFFACNKSRVPAPDSYQSLSAFHNQYKQQEQVFTIDTGTGPCIIPGAQGTRLYNVCDSSAFASVQNGTSPSYPYQLGLIEIYSIKDIILYPLPSIASGKILETDGELRVRIFTDSNQYVLRPNRQYEMTLIDSMANTTAMSVYDGVQASTYENWTLDPLSTVTVSPGNRLDSLIVFNLGWVNSAVLFNPAAQYTTATFTAGNATGTDNIEVYIVFNNFKSVMQVYNLVSGAVPVGEPITMVAIALNQNNQYVSDIRTMTVTANMSVALNLQVVSISNLLAALGALQ